jgi:hypothetical protein
MLIVAGALPAAQAKLLGIPESWESEIMHRYTFVVVVGDDVKLLGDGDFARPTMPMSLNVAGRYAWAWLLQHDGQVQLACSAGLTPHAPSDDEPASATDASGGAALLRAWVNTLKRHRVIDADAQVPLTSATQMDLPLTGALAHEGVANRTLLIGPAGGFYSACAEDIYPACWSAMYAAEVARKALTEPHLQDALGAFRHKWRTTLGDYLRGPQQNLRFLLPMVYRNQVMTTRLAEAILSGKSVVR